MRLTQHVIVKSNCGLPERTFVSATVESTSLEFVVITEMLKDDGNWKMFYLPTNTIAEIEVKPVWSED